MCSDISEWPNAHYWLVEFLNGQIQGVYDSLKGPQHLTTDVGKKLRVAGLLLCKTSVATPKMCSVLLDEAAGKIPSTMRQTRPIKVHCRQKVLTLRKFLKHDCDKPTGKRRASSKSKLNTGGPGKKPPDTRSTDARKLCRGVNRDAIGAALRKSLTCERIKSSASKKDNRVENCIAAPSVDPECAFSSSNTYTCHNSGRIRPNVEESEQAVVAQSLTGKVVSDKDAQVAEFENTANGDENKEKGENSFSLSKKRCTLEEEKGQPSEIRSCEIPKIRKTVPGFLSENAQFEVAAGCSAYHLSIQDESISRTAGCSAYPTNVTHPVEQPCGEEKVYTGEGLQPRGRYGIISLFDGVSSVVPMLKKKIGYAPVVVVLAENDNRIRSLVCNEFGYRSDEEWCYTVDGSAALYLRDVHSLVANGCRILQTTLKMFPDCKWIVVGGSPCQDLTLAGTMKGVLGLTGTSSRLFFILLCVIHTVQIAVGPTAVRFLVENAGSMQKIHLEAFCKLLSLPLRQDREYIWDPAQYGYLITRCRNFFRNYGDKEPLHPPPVVFNDRIGPLVNSSGRSIPCAPLLRAPTTLRYGIVCSSWTLYQPHALVWDYGYSGTRQEFARQAGKLVNKLPNFQWERIIPPPFLQPWLSFIHLLSTKKGSGNDIATRLSDVMTCRYSQMDKQTTVPYRHRPEHAAEARLDQEGDVAPLETSLSNCANTCMYCSSKCCLRKKGHTVHLCLIHKIPWWRRTTFLSVFVVGIALSFT